MPLVDKASCTKIQCGATTQLEAGMQAIMDCASAGYGASRSCIDPICVGDNKPTYCSPGTGINITIPYSPPNNSMHPIDEMTNPNTLDQPIMARETKRRRNYYQDQVECPNSATNPFFMGMDTWKNLSSVINTIPVMGDLGLLELIGFLVPAAAIAGVGYLYLNGRLFK